MVIPCFLYVGLLLGWALGRPFSRKKVPLEDGSDFNEDVPKDGGPHQQAHVADFQGCGHSGPVAGGLTQTHGFQKAAEGINPTPVFVHILPCPCVEFLPGVVEDHLTGLQTLMPSAPVQEVGGSLQEHHHAPLHSLTEPQRQVIFTGGQECPESLPESASPCQGVSVDVFCHQAHCQLSLVSAFAGS